MNAEEAATTKAVLRQIANGQLPRYTREKRYLAKDGRIVWGRVTTAVLHDHEGNMMCVLAMIENITERKLSEQALRRAERLASIGTLAERFTQ